MIKYFFPRVYYKLLNITIRKEITQFLKIKKNIFKDTSSGLGMVGARGQLGKKETLVKLKTISKKDTSLKNKHIVNRLM